MLEIEFEEGGDDTLTYVKREFERDAKAGHLTIWGKELMMGAIPSDTWDYIEPEFWEKNRISWNNIILGGPAKTESKSAYGGGDQYEDLMVSKAEIEDKWQHG